MVWYGYGRYGEELNEKEDVLYRVVQRGVGRRSVEIDCMQEIEHGINIRLLAPTLR